MRLIETDRDKFVKQTIEFKLDKEQQKYVLIHNINLKKYSWQMIIYQWAKDTQAFTPESLCAYINSKRHITENMAFTEDQWGEMNRIIQS